MILCIGSCYLWGNLFNKDISNFSVSQFAFTSCFVCAETFSTSSCNFLLCQIQTAKVLEVSQGSFYDVPAVEESEQALSFPEVFSASMARVGFLSSMVYCRSEPLCILSECGEGIAIPLLHCCTFSYL